MKLFSERFKKGTLPTRGYLAKCKRCGRVVVHAESTGEPFHMHARSRRCRDGAGPTRAQLQRTEYFESSGKYRGSS